MSIKNYFLKKRSFGVYLIFLLFSFFYLLPGKANAWFHQLENSGLNLNYLPYLENRQPSTKVSSKFIILQNNLGGSQSIRLHPGFTKGEDGISAGVINIDIPFGILSKSAINPEFSLDRQIATNLRLKNIIDEYLALKKRNAKALEGLRIPYLEKNNKKKKINKTKTQEKIKTEEEIKQKIENVVIFSDDFKSNQLYRHGPIPQPTGLVNNYRPKDIPIEDKLRLQTTSNSPGKSSKIDKNNKTQNFESAYYERNKLPKIFKYILDFIGYAIENKFEILLWAAVLSMISLMGIIVVRR